MQIHAKITIKNLECVLKNPKDFYQTWIQQIL